MWDYTLIPYKVKVKLVLFLVGKKKILLNWENSNWVKLKIGNIYCGHCGDNKVFVCGL